MMKLFLPYNKTILKTNIIFSLFLTLLSSVAILNDKSSHTLIYLTIWFFVVWIMTGGFILSVFYFEITRKTAYYFYYNLGLGRIKLLLFTYILHMVFILPLLFILHYV